VRSPARGASAEISSDREVPEVEKASPLTAATEAELIIERRLEVERTSYLTAAAVAASEARAAHALELAALLAEKDRIFAMQRAHLINVTRDLGVLRLSHKTLTTLYARDWQKSSKK
jgi:hypothetical protein